MEATLSHFKSAALPFCSLQALQQITMAHFSFKLAAKFNKGNNSKDFSNL
jgi:hypothetical protein